MTNQPPICEAARCHQPSIVAWGPKPMWLCQQHFEKMLKAAGRVVEDARVLLGKSAP